MYHLKHNQLCNKTWNNKAIAHIKIGELEHALNLIEQVIRMNPNSPSSWYTKHLIYKEKGDAQSAENFLQKAKLLGLKEEEVT